MPSTGTSSMEFYSHPFEIWKLNSWLAGLKGRRENSAFQGGLAGWVRGAQDSWSQDHESEPHVGGRIYLKKEIKSLPLGLFEKKKKGMNEWTGRWLKLVLRKKDCFPLWWTSGYSYPGGARVPVRLYVCFEIGTHSCCSTLVKAAMTSLVLF